MQFDAPHLSIFKKEDIANHKVQEETLAFSPLLCLAFSPFEGEKVKVWILTIESFSTGARVYITGRRMEVLQQAAKTHSPDDGGEIIP